MRTFDISRIKLDKRYLIAYIIAIITSIILGIVLCKTTQTSPYMQNYASEYVYYVFNFRNGSLLLPRYLSVRVFSDCLLHQIQVHSGRNSVFQVPAFVQR